MIKEPLGDSVAGRVLSRLYGAGVTLRNRRYDRSSRAIIPTGRPTISVGGIHAGGTGKTPMAHLIGTWLTEAGRTVAYLSRGYGRRSRHTLIVEPGQPSHWSQVGDEPAMLHQLLPRAWLGIGADRRTTAHALAARLDPHGVFVLDDGFQHRRLHRDLDIVCLPSDPLSGRLIPAGYMREPLQALARAGILCVIGAEEEAERIMEGVRKVRGKYPSKQVFALQQKAHGWVDARTGQTVKKPPSKSSALVCGIARPERFIDMVRRMGIETTECIVRPDHHVFSHEEIQAIAGRGYTRILTTHKDACRLSANNLVNGPDICYLRVTLAFLEKDQEKRFRAKVLEAVTGKAG